MWFPHKAWRARACHVLFTYSEVKRIHFLTLNQFNDDIMLLHGNTPDNKPYRGERS